MEFDTHGFIDSDAFSMVLNSSRESLERITVTLGDRVTVTGLYLILPSLMASSNISFNLDLSFGNDGISSKDFAKELKTLGLVDSIDLYLNSDGGDVFEGFAIYESIRRHPAHVTVYIDGLAASIASVIALAGSEIIMAANSMMMIHNPWCAAEEPHDAKLSTLLNKIRVSILDVYTKKTGSDRNVIENMMDDEYWMDAAEAVALGFADEISVPQQIAAQYDLSRFRNPPNTLTYNYGVDLRQPSKARAQMVARARIAYCQKKSLQILRDRNRIN